MNGAEESDCARVPIKEPNKGESQAEGSNAEAAERRVRTKENISQTHTNPTQGGKKGVSQGLAGVRRAARESKVGTPRAAVISPLLANIYLHYAFDLCVEAWWRKVARSDVIVVRCPVDAVLGFERKDEAERFLHDVRERLARFGLELHPEKTRLIEFGRFAAANRKKWEGGKPETFDFLGFTHICGTARRMGYFVAKRKTVKKRMRAKLQVLKAELRQRMHEPKTRTGAWFESVVRDHFQYHAVPGNMESLSLFRLRLARLWRHVLRRRSETHRPNWQRLQGLFNRWLPRPCVLHPYPPRGLTPYIQGKSRMR